MILDGWGTSPDPKVSAIDHAQTPYIDSLYSKYAHASLRTDGLHVGLPEGQMGNSEVGHMNLGAGRIVYQDLAKINLAVKNNTLAAEAVLENAIAYAKSNNKPIHLLGLVSDGGVHSHIDHLFGLIDALEKNNIPKGFVHAFTDGRDVDPKSGLGFISSLESRLKDSNVKLASVIGRYYAMDRDKRWERTKLAYDAAVHGIGEQVTNATASIKNSYANGARFINEIVMDEESDVNEKGEVKSHFEMYIDSMDQIEANTAPIKKFTNAIHNGASIDTAAAMIEMHPAIKAFLDLTFGVIAEGKPHCIAAAFTFGREDVIPDMF